MNVFLITYAGDVNESMDIKIHTTTVINYKHGHNTSMDERLNRLLQYHSQMTIHLAMMLLSKSQD